jgi:hypothetical protein
MSILRLQRTWPSFSSTVAGMSGFAFGEAVQMPKVGHAAEAACYPDAT